MRNIIFIAPFFAETTLRFISAAASVPESRLTLVSQDPEEKLPVGLRRRLAGHVRVENGLDPVILQAAIARLVDRLGPVDRLLGTLEELQVPLGRIRDELGIEGMGADTALNFRDKGRMKAVLAEAGLPVARNRVCASVEEAVGFAAELGFRVVAKQPEGSGARGTFRVADESRLREALSFLKPDLRRPVLVEEFVSGREHSFDSVMVEGRIVWHSVNEYLPSPLEVLSNPWIQWTVMLPRPGSDDAIDGMRPVAESALRALGMETGLSHMEWFLRPDGRVALSEVGARPPGAQFTSLISWAHDFDLYAAWARLMVRGEFDPPSPQPYAAGAAYVRGQGRGRVTAIHGLEEIVERCGPLIVESRLPRIGQAPSSSYEGEGFVIVRHPDDSVVREALSHIVSTMRVELQ